MMVYLSPLHGKYQRTELKQAKIPFTCFQIQKDITHEVDKEQLQKQRENTGKIVQQQCFWTVFRTQPGRLPASYLGQISHDFLISSNCYNSFNDWIVANNDREGCRSSSHDVT
jgi:hypothetical protein